MDLNQTHSWTKSNGQTIDLADMHPRHAANAYAAMLRKADHLVEPGGISIYFQARNGDELAAAYLAAQTSEHPRAWLARQPLMRAVAAIANGEDLYDFLEREAQQEDEQAYLDSLLSDEPVDEVEYVASVQDAAEYAAAVTALTHEFEARLRALRARFGTSTPAPRTSSPGRTAGSSPPTRHCWSSSTPTSCCPRATRSPSASSSGRCPTSSSPGRPPPSTSSPASSSTP